jgi:hypothetical protein
MIVKEYKKKWYKYKMDIYQLLYKLEWESWFKGIIQRKKIKMIRKFLQTEKPLSRIRCFKCRQHSYCFYKETLWTLPEQVMIKDIYGRLWIVDALSKQHVSCNV